MYHILIMQDGYWNSFGLHVTSWHYSIVLDSFKLMYGEENVANIFWGPDDNLGTTDDVRTRAIREVEFANQAQSKWDRGDFAEAETDGHFNLARGIYVLREGKLPSVRV